MAAPLSDSDYAALSDFRFEIRRFAAFSESQAAAAGLTPQQHQALLAIRGARTPVTIGLIADRLILKPNSVTGLLDRLAVLGHIRRVGSPGDRRQKLIELTASGEALLERLTSAHRAELVRIRPALADLLARLS